MTAEVLPTISGGLRLRCLAPNSESEVELRS